MVGFTLKKEERDAGGMPGLLAAAGATSTCRNLCIGKCSYSAVGGFTLVNLSMTVCFKPKQYFSVTQVLLHCYRAVKVSLFELGQWNPIASSKQGTDHSLPMGKTPMPQACTKASISMHGSPIEAAAYIQMACMLVCMLGCLLQSLHYTGSIPKRSFLLAVGIERIVSPSSRPSLPNLPDL